MRFKLQWTLLFAFLVYLQSFVIIIPLNSITWVDKINIQRKKINQFIMPRASTIENITYTEKFPHAQHFSCCIFGEAFVHSQEVRDNRQELVQPDTHIEYLKVHSKPLLEISWNAYFGKSIEAQQLKYLTIAISSRAQSFNQNHLLTILSGHPIH